MEDPGSRLAMEMLRYQNMMDEEWKSYWYSPSGVRHAYETTPEMQMWEDY